MQLVSCLGGSQQFFSPAGRSFGIKISCRRQALISFILHHLFDLWTKFFFYRFPSNNRTTATFTHSSSFNMMSKFSKTLYNETLAIWTAQSIQFGGELRKKNLWERFQVNQESRLTLVISAFFCQYLKKNKKYNFLFSLFFFFFVKNRTPLEQ